MSENAFVDTTVFTDALLKEGERKEQAEQALTAFDETELPVYTIKEFKAGPLQHYVYLHNKLSKTDSFEKTIKALSELPHFWSRKQDTALEAFHTRWIEIGEKNLSEITEDASGDPKLDSWMTARIRLGVKRRILKAWRKRRKLTSDVVDELPCYNESEPRERRGELHLDDKKCDPNPECCMADDFRSDDEAVSSLMSAIETLPKNTENGRRYSVLKELYEDANTDIKNEKCRHLGDAVFALYCPSDSLILTTNVKDHRALAEALGKGAVKPEEALEPS
jgi:predicted nucleic acid-binding protein